MSGRPRMICEATCRAASRARLVSDRMELKREREEDESRRERGREEDVSRREREREQKEIETEGDEECIDKSMEW